MSLLEVMAVGIVVLGLFFFLYTYLGYPLLLWLVDLLRRKDLGEARTPAVWPTVSISVPAYNEEDQIEGLLESLLALDYPLDRRQILIISDASSDRTDDLVSRYADRGVELHRVEERGGKTKAEAAGAPLLRGEIIVNTDASIRIHPRALRSLVAVFSDPEIGLASGRDVSVDPGEGGANVGESGYVGYEMAVRDLETRVSGIVGASGSFYAVRRELHQIPLPDHLSRDFASALLTTERGFRAVSVPDAICHVPRTSSLRKEFRRKVRTIARGMDTLWHEKALLNPYRFGLFSWMLFSHKICRWALPWMVLAAWIALGVLAVTSFWAAGLFGLGVLILVLGWIGWVRAEEHDLPRIFSIPAYLIAGNLAAMKALLQFLKRDRVPYWEPTRRGVANTGPRV